MAPGLWVQSQCPSRGQEMCRFCRPPPHVREHCQNRGTATGGEDEKPETEHKDGWTCSFRNVGPQIKRTQGRRPMGLERCTRKARLHIRSWSPDMKESSAVRHLSMCLEGDWEEAVTWGKAAPGTYYWKDKRTEQKWLHSVGNKELLISITHTRIRSHMSAGLTCNINWRQNNFINKMQHLIFRRWLEILKFNPYNNWTLWQ